MKLGYTRISHIGQLPKQERGALESCGCKEIYADIDSGDPTEQPELVRLLGHLKPQDTIVVTKLNRLSFFTDKLIKIIEGLEKRQVQIVSLDEDLDTRTEHGWKELKKTLRWSVNEELPDGTAIIYLWLDCGYGHVKIQNCKTGIEELDKIAEEAVKLVGCGEETGYPGFDVANWLIDVFGGEIERIEYGKPRD